MILINNQEIIEVTNTSNLDEVFQSYEFCFSDIPFVEILRDNKDSYKCIIGYINIKTKEKIDADIMIKNHWCPKKFRIAIPDHHSLALI